jgi:acyl carrier protein
MLDRIRKIIINLFECDNIEITEKTDLVRELQLNSLDIVNLVTEIEEAFDTEIPERKLSEFVTIGDIINYLDKR